MDPNQDDQDDIDPEQDPEHGHGLGKFGPKTMYEEWENIPFGDEWNEVPPEGAPPLTDNQMLELNSHRIRHVVFHQPRLGVGAYGTVYRVECDYRPDETSEWEPGTYACKVIHYTENTEADIEEAMNDMLILRYLRHDNICNMVDYIPIPDSISGFPVAVVCVFMEMCHGSLEDLVVEGRADAGVQPNDYWCFSEQLCRHWFTHITRGLEYIHSQGVTHLDIKESNILYVAGTPTEDTFDSRFLSSTFKLCDFGISMQVMPWLGEHQNIPSQKTDIKNLLEVLFNTGVIGSEQHIGIFLNRCRANNWTGDIPQQWVTLSPLLKDLMNRMNSTQRMTAHEILSHQWVTNG